MSTIRQIPGGPFLVAPSGVTRQIPGWQFVSATPAGSTTYTLSAPTYVPGSITSTGLTARVMVTAA